VESRYSGKIWHEEEVAGSLDPRLKRKDENLEALNMLKGNIEGSIRAIRREFENASRL